MTTVTVEKEIDAVSQDASEQLVILSDAELEHVGGGNLVANF